MDNSVHICSQHLVCLLENVQLIWNLGSLCQCNTATTPLSPQASPKRRHHADVVNAAPPIQSARTIPLTRDAPRGACVTPATSSKCLCDVILRASAASYPVFTTGLSDALKMLATSLGFYWDDSLRGQLPAYIALSIRCSIRPASVMVAVRPYICLYFIRRPWSMAVEAEARREEGGDMGGAICWRACKI